MTARSCYESYMGLRRIISRIRAWREKPPAMIGVPPSARPAVPEDPADHAEDFSWRYAQDLDIVAGQAMMDLGIDDDQTGARDSKRRDERHSFHPGDRSGGSNNPAGQIIVDSGIMNPNLFDEYYDVDTQKLWRKSRLKTRVEAIIAHEYEEHRHGSDHSEALRHAPTTELPICHEARELCRQMERGWNGWNRR